MKSAKQKKLEQLSCECTVSVISSIMHYAKNIAMLKGDYDYLDLFSPLSNVFIYFLSKSRSLNSNIEIKELLEDFSEFTIAAYEVYVKQNGVIE